GAMDKVCVAAATYMLSEWPVDRTCDSSCSPLPPDTLAPLAERSPLKGLELRTLVGRLRLGCLAGLPESLGPVEPGRLSPRPLLRSASISFCLSARLGTGWARSEPSAACLLLFSSCSRSALDRFSSSSFAFLASISSRRAFESMAG